MTCAAEDVTTVFLSRFQMDEAVASNPYEIHRCLWSAFPGMPEADRPFLFRADWAARPLDVLMQSSVEPTEPERLAAKLVETRAFRLNLADGTTHRFRLCANPTKREARSRRRVPLHAEADRLAWLTRQLTQVGAVLSAEVVAAQTLSFHKKQHRGVVATVEFAGEVLVQDATALRNLMLGGVGPAKSFGCGLLLLGSD